MRLGIGRKPYEYIVTVDPDTEWRSGFFGFALRLRTIALAVIGQIALAVWALMGTMPHQASLLLIAILLLSTSLMLYVRRTRLARVYADEAIHRFAHDLRDRVYDINSAATNEIRHIRIEQFFSQITEDIAAYYRERRMDKTINCVLRIADVEDSGQECYRTVGRSKGLADERGRRTQPESAEQGISRKLIEHKGQGAYLIHDRLSATRDGVWHLSANDTLDDVDSILSLPINGWYGTDLKMLGIMHLTTRSGSLRRGDWVALKAFADLLGHVFSNIYNAPVSETSPHHLSTGSRS